jgi:hypothetical protein
VLYGTNINSSEVQTKIRNFFMSFMIIDENSEDYQKAPFYMEQLEGITIT